VHTEFACDLLRIAERACAKFAVLLFLELGGCSAVPRYLDDSERELGVNTTWYGSNLRIYHSVLLDPAGIALRWPGYLIGVENIHPRDRAYLDRGGWRENHVITHVMRFNQSWLGEFGQGDRWRFCLTAAGMARAQERR
jgi:hypothetical protein